MSPDDADGRTPEALSVWVLQKRVGALIRKVRRIAVHVEGIEFSLMQLEKHILRLPDGPGRLLPEASPRPASARQASSLTLDQVDGEKFVAKFVLGEVTKKVVLPRALGELLRLLRSDNGQSDDQLIGWWSVADIIEWVEKGKKDFPRHPAWHARRKHRVAQLVYRLRVTFDGAGIDRTLIQTSASKGIRLALVRKRALPESQMPPFGGPLAANQGSDRG